MQVAEYAETQVTSSKTLDKNENTALSELAERIMNLQREDYASPCHAAEVITNPEWQGEKEPSIQPNGHRVARAIVSDSFKPIDDNLLVPPMLEIFGDYASEWKAIGGQITETKSYINFVSRTPQITLNIAGRARPLHIGVRYSNSEVGRGRYR